MVNVNTRFYLRRRSRAEIIPMLSSTPEDVRLWQLLPPEHQERLITIFQRKQILKLPYDHLFQILFHPKTHPRRLERFLSILLKQSVKIKNGNPMEMETNTQCQNSTQLLMNIQVELSDHSLAHIEIQHSSEANTTLLSENLKDYSQIQKLFIIVFMDSSTPAIRACSSSYLHQFTQPLHTDVQPDLLQEYYFFALDAFRDLVLFPYNELEAWLTFISAEDISEVNRVCAFFPYFINLKEDVILYLENNPSQALALYWEGLSIPEISYCGTQNSPG